MPLIINQQPVEQDEWTLVSTEELEAGIPDGKIIVPFAFYQAEQSQLSSKSELAVSIHPDQDNIEEVIAASANFSVIAIFFPILRDGRGFSLARLLRRAGYKGQIRAIGNVTQDRLGFMQRCGFDAADILEEYFSPTAVKAFTEFSRHYQGAEDDSRPIYRQ